MLSNALIFLLFILFFIWWLWKKSHFSLAQISIILPIASIIFLLALGLSFYASYSNSILPEFIFSSTIEESSRAIIFFLTLSLRKKYFSTPFDQLKFAFIAGFVFSLLENVGYLISLPPLFFTIRPFITTPLHIFLSMLQIRWKLRGFFLAWVIHTLYNLAYETTFVILLLAQMSTMLLWFVIAFWLKKYKPQPFSAF